MKIENIIIPLFLIAIGLYFVFRVPTLVRRGIEKGKISPNGGMIIRWIIIAGYIDMACGAIMLIVTLFGWNR